MTRTPLGHIGHSPPAAIAAAALAVSCENPVSSPAVLDGS
jgi:hypothetical protein